MMILDLLPATLHGAQVFFMVHRSSSWCTGPLHGTQGPLHGAQVLFMVHRSSSWYIGPLHGTQVLFMVLFMVYKSSSECTCPLHGTHVLFMVHTSSSWYTGPLSITQVLFMVYRPSFYYTGPLHAPEIRSGDLEETLVYEDLFLEYFNVFLALPAFPVRLYYDRLTGNVQELDGAPQEEEYGANDVQHEQTLCWLRQERLPLFRKSPLHLEYKLVKLLLRPLEDPQPVSRYGVRGYSRQTTGAALSSGQTSTVPQLLSAPMESPRPFPSRARSGPAAPGYESEPYSLSLLEQYGDAIIRLYQPPERPIAESEFYASFRHSGAGEVEVQVSPPPQSQEDRSTLTVCRFFKEMDMQMSPPLQSQTETSSAAPYGFLREMDTQMSPPPQSQTKPYSSRTQAEQGGAARAGGDQDLDWMDPEDIDTISEEEENFLRQNNLPPSSLQHLKEAALSSRGGVARFTDFLRGTLGFHLLHYWLDCEQFKEESVELEVSRSPEEARHRCVHLFRSIQNKYRTYLSPAWQEQIRLSQQDWGPSYQALRRSQYDALRRLRAYWIPRFLIHQQRRIRHRAERREKLEDLTTEIPDMTASIISDHVLSPGGRDEGKGVTSVPGQQEALRSQKTPSESLLDRMVPALTNDGAAGGPFTYYLKRFEPPQYTQIFLLYQELSENEDSGSDQRDGGERRRESGYGLDVYLRSAGTPGRGPGGRPDAASHVTPELIQSSDFWSMYRLVLTALCDPWLRFLSYDIATFLKYCAAASFKPQETESLESPSPKAGQKRAGKESQQWTGTSEDTKKKVRRRKDHLRLSKFFPEFPGQLPSDPDTLLEMLQNRTVYKLYRKVVHETEEPQTLKALEILSVFLQSDKSPPKTVGLVQKVLELDIIHLPHLQGLKKHLSHELSKGRVSSLSVKEVTTFLSSLLAPSFHNFWSEMTARLKDYGVEAPGGEGWARLEPILQVLTGKMVLKRLHGRKNNAGHQPQAQPTVEDISAFNRALRLAAEGWPTPEVLHFLRYIQTHVPEEGLPLLENNLLCCLEVQKYKNAHHAMPDLGLLRRKVQVVKERFLQQQGNPVLQAPPEILEAALKNTESAVHADLPAISTYDQLRDSLCDSLLPFWAGFRKTWLIRSSESAKKVPMLRVQQMLQKRLALFEGEEIPLRTFHLPPVQRPPEKRPPSGLTFSFSITHGITVKGMGEEGRESQTPPAGRKLPQIAVLPPINRTSPDHTQPNASEITAIPELISSQ
ncbi:uncharacterized protein ACMZJ9_007741 [Mantella aurantiaca]